MGGGKGRGRGSSHVPSAGSFPSPFLTKETAAPTLGGWAAWYSGKQGGEGLWGWPWAGGGACLPLLCPPPRVKAKVIPQPLEGWAGRGGGSTQTKNRSPRELGAGGGAPGTPAGPAEGGAAGTPLARPHPPDCPASYLHKSLRIPGPHRTFELGQGQIWIGGKLRPREERQSQS